jgi:chemotaxis protein MotA
VDPATLIGVAVALGGILVSMIIEGSSPMAIVLIPPMLLVFGGTFGAAVAGSAMADVTKVGGWFKKALMPEKVPPLSDRIAVLVGLAEKARKEGLLALEAQVKTIEDPFLKRGLQMGIDGTDPEELRATLEGEISAKKAEDKVAAKFFTAMGGYAPTVGIIGTVVGLIHVLENLSNPESLGPLIAGAFVATLWGVLSANVFWLPMAAKITRTSDMQAAQMELLVEGIAEIQAGTSPRAVRLKLNALVPPSEIAKEAA